MDATAAYAVHAGLTVMSITKAETVFERWFSGEFPVSVRGTLGIDVGRGVATVRGPANGPHLIPVTSSAMNGVAKSAGWDRFEVLAGLLPVGVGCNGSVIQITKSATQTVAAKGKRG